MATPYGVWRQWHAGGKIAMSKMAKKTKTVSNLETEDCRWPIGDPRDADFHFCGAERTSGRPYCDMHWRMSFVPSRPRYQTSHQDAKAQALAISGLPALTRRRAA
jgi:hypothetical protein